MAIADPSAPREPSASTPSGTFPGGTSPGGISDRGAPAAAGGRDGAGTGLIASLDGRYGVSPDRPIPGFDSPQAKAYSVELMPAGGNGLFALLCPPRIPARVELVETLRKQPIAGMLRLVDSALFDWPLDGQRKLAFIFERPTGPRLMVDGPAAAAATALGVDGAEDTAMRMPGPELHGIIGTAVAVLKRFAERNLTHRAIRPWNFFYTGRGAGDVVLGECLTGPPAFDQPDWLEPIESAMADPSGRGDGRPADDLFSLGATILTLAIGRNPVAGLSPETVMKGRIAKGSFATLAASHALSPGLVDLLRGLLNDTPRERWTPGDVERWLTGRYPAVRTPIAHKPADRPFRYAEGDHEDGRSLAHAFATHWEDAASVVRGPRLVEWVKRSLPDKERADAVMTALRSKPGGLSSGGTEDNARLVAAVCMALDPAAPIRFRDVSVTLDGLGAAVFIAEDKPERRQMLARLVMQRLPSQWAATQDGDATELLRHARSSDNLVPLVNKGAPGFGYERLVYELNPHAHCLSPMIERWRVVEARDLLPALEMAAAGEAAASAADAKPGAPRRGPIDRHIAAFLAVRFKSDSSWLAALTEPEGSPAAAMAPLVALAKLQNAMHGAPAPHVAQWLARHLKPVLDAVHHRPRREHLEIELNRLAGEGMLPPIAQLLGDTHAQNEDRRGFQAAQRRFRQLANEHQRLDREIAQVSAIATAQSGPVAVAASFAIAAASLVIVSSLS
ncbi:MAG: hypothetical protein FJX11_24930 [Alphaproteobacteria bacterium]|nr:hypothetical protein [Alphaproteobacteria bacterium]